MDVRPKSNKQKRLEAKRRRERRARERDRPADGSRPRPPERARKAAARTRRGTRRQLRVVLEGQTVHVPPWSDLNAVAELFDGLRKAQERPPTCRGRTSGRCVG